MFPLLSRIGLSEPIGVVDLAELVGRDHSTVSRQVATLESLGLVERRATNADRRVRLLRPTAAGRAMLRKFSETRRKFLNERLGDWADDERALLLDLLKRFSARIAEFGACDDVGGR